jgi:hypothetical protein
MGKTYYIYNDIYIYINDRYSSPPWRHEHLHGQTSLQRQNVEGLAAAAAIAAACADGEMCCKHVQTAIVAHLKTTYYICVDVG